MVILHNMAAMNANNMLNINNSKRAKSMEKLSSGYRINRSADDAAGLSISEKMRRQIRGLSIASENAQDGISLTQVADGALNETHEILQRMNELTVKASNGTNSPSDCEAIQAEIDQLVEEVDRIAVNTAFNEKIKPLYGGMAKEGSEFPPAVGDRSITVVNNSKIPVVCDGVTYNPGDSFIVDNVLTIKSGSDYSVNEVSAIFHHYDGGGSGYFIGKDPSLPFEILVPDTVTGSDKLTYHTIEDVQIDDNGYLYVMDLGRPGMNIRYYMGETGFHEIADPTVEKLEAAGILKATQNTTGGTLLGLQVGAEAGTHIAVTMVNATAGALGVENVDVSTPEKAETAISKISNAIETVSRFRSHFGSVQNRLEHTIANLDNITENLQTAESKIRDTDMAKEMVALSNSSIISQVSQSMLAQANQQTQGVLSLLQG